MNQLEANEKRDNNPSGSPNNLEKEALRRIELFRRETREETAAALDNKAEKSPGKIRYSTRVRVVQVASQETTILHRKLATVLERTPDMEIWRLLKALHQRYLCVDLDELYERLDLNKLYRDVEYIAGLVQRANAHLAKTRLGIKIHLRNGFLLLGPEKETENIDVVNNPETRKTLHYTGTKFNKPTAEQKAPATPAAAVEAISKKTYLGRIKANVAIFKQGQFSLEYQIAELLAEAADNSDIDPERGYGLTTKQIAKRLGIHDYKITSRIIGRLKTALKKMGMELAILPGDTKLGIDEDIYTIGWMPSGDLPKNIDDMPGKKDDDDDDWARPLSSSSAGDRNPTEDPDDILPAFRDKKIKTAEEFNELIYDAMVSLVTDFREMSKHDARKLLRSVKALEVNPPLQSRIEKWGGRVSTGIRSTTYQTLQPQRVTGLMDGIKVDKVDKK